MIYKEKKTFNFIVMFRPSVLVNKEMMTRGEHFNKTKLELQSLEINPGLRFTIGRISTTATYRIMSLQKIDHVIIDKHLFEDDNDPYLSRKFDDYNISKFTFTVGYTL